MSSRLVGILKCEVHVTAEFATSLDLGEERFSFSTIYVASSAPFRLPTFFAAWIVPAGMKRTSPGLSVTGGFPSTGTPAAPLREHR